MPLEIFLLFLSVNDPLLWKTIWKCLYAQGLISSFFTGAKHHQLYLTSLSKLPSQRNADPIIEIYVRFVSA